MGLESGNKPVQQGEAGFLTQDELDELNGTGASEPEALETPVEVEAPKVEENVDMSFANLGQETAPAAPLSPERRAEVMEQIGEEEKRLETNVQRSDEVMGAAEQRVNDTSAPESRKLLTSAKIAEAYSKAKDRLLELYAVGTVGGLGAVIGGAMAYDHSRALNQAMDMQEMMTNHWQHLSENLVNGGVTVAVASIAVAGIGRGLAWLKMRSQEKKLYGV